MNIFKWLANRAGKVALSTLQMVGLGAVGAAGVVAAGSFLLGDSSSDNTAFSPAAYNPGEVVYMAGANTGSYAGGSYAGGGESQSSMQISTNTFKRLEQHELARQAAEEMAEYAPDYSSAASAPASGPAYQMGATEGLGTGANAANELSLKNDPMAAAMQQSMAGMSGMISQVTQQAQQAQAAQQAAQQAAGENGNSGSAPTLASASKNWGSSGSAGGSGGNAFNASFSIQDSGKNTDGKSGASAAEAQAALASAQAQMQQAMAEGAKIRGRASFGKDSMIGANRDASIQNFRNSKDSKDLEFIRKRSADAAKNRNRSANEGARAFLASTKISGGMMISSENVTTGQGQGSKDFNQDYDSTLRGIKNWGMGKIDEQNRRDKDRHSMQTWFWVAVGVAVAAAVAIPFVKRIKIFGVPIFALALAAIATAFCAIGFAKAQAFADTWGSSGFATTARILTPILLAGVWASFFFSGSAKAMKEASMKSLGLVIGGTGAGALGVGYMAGSFGGKNEAALEGDSSSK